MIYLCSLPYRKVIEAVQLSSVGITRSKSMENQAHIQQRVFIEMQSESLAIDSRADGGESAADVAHSENNILQWMEYLPEDCIRTMILMGWDITT
jgi:hypothetical protein